MNKKEMSDMLNKLQELDNIGNSPSKASETSSNDDNHENFDIIPRFMLLNFLAKHGSARDKLLAYFCMHRDSNNLVCQIQTEIAENSKISLRTVKKEINYLVKQGVIKKKNGIIMVNPDFIVRGSKQKRSYLHKEYLAFNKRKISIQKQITKQN